jgi:cell division transport system ATP-binding protein
VCQYFGMTTQQAILRLRGVQKKYPPDQFALQGINLELFPGEFLFIAGASGAGKTTLLRLLFGAEQATSGEVVVAGRNMVGVNADGVAELRREIGIVFQDYKLLENRSVVDNVGFGLESLGIERSARHRLAERLLDVLDLGDRGQAFPSMLSGGEQQRVALARALIHKPKLLIADEPTGNLDPEMSRRIFDLLLEANAAGVTVVVATHNLAMIEELDLRTVVLDQGKIIGDFARTRA